MKLNDKYAYILFVTGIIIIILGIIGASLLASHAIVHNPYLDTNNINNFLMIESIAGGITSILTGIFFIGLARIIDLLSQVSKKDKTL